jgi:hypothetical protein
MGYTEGHILLKKIRHKKNCQENYQYTRNEYQYSLRNLQIWHPNLLKTFNPLIGGRHLALYHGPGHQNRPMKLFGPHATGLTI